MKTAYTVTRGVERLLNPTCIPIYDAGAVVKYEGSISKIGDNADWDWGMYKDEKGEWVLMEADGAGCIYNFTQHRYPTSEVPVFRFYFDGADDPVLEVTPADFGTKYPLVKPYADKFVGPIEQGFGPIWVVRSFIPMPYRTHCKVTSSIRLTGCNKEKGEGGWGHVMYQSYDSADGIQTFDGSFDAVTVTALYQNWAGSPLLPATSPLAPGEKRVVYSKDGIGALKGVYAAIDGYVPADFQNIWVHITFDDTAVPQVSTPLGAFFGCEFGDVPAHLNTLLLEQNTTVNPAVFRNSCPMPYFSRVEISLENKGERICYCGLEAKDDPELIYDQRTTGYFTASSYYPTTPNTDGKNSVIADIHGAGQVVYAVLTGKGSLCGCEGDVRVFVDDMSSPTVESDGSESWASYGWGFVMPPQSNPFSAYNGRYMVNDDWSELRLTFTDSYVFRNRLRFELEHGCQNDGGGTHSGQVFYYAAPHSPESFLGEFTPECGLDFTGEAKVFSVHDRFENGIHEEYRNFTCLQGETDAALSIFVPAECKGLILRRVCLQKDNPMSACVLVNGKPVSHNWFFPDSNPYYSLLEDDFFISAAEITPGSDAEITVQPLTKSWNACRYRVFALV